MMRSANTPLRSPLSASVVTLLTTLCAGGCDLLQNQEKQLEQQITLGGAELLLEFQPSTAALELGLLEATLTFHRVRLYSADVPGHIDVEIPPQQVDFVRGERVSVPMPPVGRFTSISLIATGGTGHWASATGHGELAAPSASQSGLKLHTPTFEIPPATSGLRTRVEVRPEGVTIKATGGGQPKKDKDETCKGGDQGSCHAYRVHPVVVEHDITLGVSLPGGAELSGGLVGDVHEVVFAELPEQPVWIDLGDGHRVALDRDDGCTPDQTVWLARVRGDEAILASDTIVAFPHQTLCGSATLELPTAGRGGGNIVRNNTTALPTEIAGDVARATLTAFSLYNYQSCAEVTPTEASFGWCLDLGEGDNVLRDVIFAQCKQGEMLSRVLCPACTEAAEGALDSCAGPTVPVGEELCHDAGNTQVRRDIRIEATAMIGEPSLTSKTAYGIGKWQTDLEGDGPNILAAAKAVPGAFKQSRAAAVEAAKQALGGGYSQKDAETFAKDIVAHYEKTWFDPSNLQVDNTLLDTLGIRAQCREFQERIAIDAGATMTHTYGEADLNPLPASEHRAGMGFYKGGTHAGLITRIIYGADKTPLMYQLVDSNRGGGFSDPKGEPPMRRQIRGQWVDHATFAAGYKVLAFDADPDMDKGPCAAPVLPPQICGFPDTNPDEPALGADFGAGAADVLQCAKVLEGYPDQCPSTVDSQTKALLCPDYALSKSYAGSQVMCGSCNSSRVDQLAFGIKALIKPEIIAEDIYDCAKNDTCDSWDLCEEAEQGSLTATRPADFIGWAMAPGREYFRGDGENLDPDEIRPCRPHDGALWIEAASFLARLSGTDESLLNDDIIDVSGALEYLEDKFAEGCSLPGIKEGSDWWTPAVVALHNADLYCMPTVNDLHSADICGDGDLASCYATRYVMATIVARMRKDIPLADCDPIDTLALDCP